MATPTTQQQIRLLQAALKSPDRTVLAVGFGKAHPDAAYPSFHATTANSLLERGFIEWVKATVGGSVYRLTRAGEQYIKSYGNH